jgi:hypothetical protein
LVPVGRIYNPRVYTNSLTPLWESIRAARLAGAPLPNHPLRPQEPQLNLDARAQAFLERIAPLSADLAAHGRTRALALKKLRRICQAEVGLLKTNCTPATVKFYLSKY